MPAVLTTCPTSGDLIPTGIVVDDADEIHALDEDSLLVACPNCGRDHWWTPQEAVVAPA